MSLQTESALKDGIFDWKLAPSKFDKVDQLLAFGKTEQLAQGGSLLFLDEAKFFEGGQPSAELQAAIDQLREHGVDVVILTSNNPDNLETSALRDQMTAANGLGSYGDGTLAPRALICIYNNHTTDSKREVVCVTGDALNTVISKSDTSAAVDKIINGILAGNIDSGFTDAYNGFDRILDARDARATQQAAPQPTSIPYEAPIATPQEIQPSVPEKSFMEKHGSEVYGGVSAVILMALIGADQMFAKPRRIFVKSVETAKRSALSEYGKLNADAGKGLSLFDSIASAYNESYPDKASETREERQAFSEKLDEVKQAYDDLLAARVGFFQKKTDMSEVREKAVQLRSEAMTLARSIEDKSNQSEDLHQKEQSARTNAYAAQEKFDEIKDKWYEEKLGAFRAILPPKDKALAGIESKLKEAVDNALYKTELALRGSNQAIEVLAMLEKFMLAVSAFTHGYEVSYALHKDSGLDLGKWPDRAIGLDQLANSGVKLLDKAKAGISIPEKMDDVIDLSAKAEKEFASAKDFSSASATVFKQQDENDRQIAEIEEKGGFWDKHIKGLRDEMAEALSKANSTATQGNWKEAQAQLGILRVKTNESLVEMKRLEQLHEQNINDLENIAKEVEKDKKRYSSETTKAWTDLSENFVPANYDEKDKIWKELRSDSESSEKVVIADLNPYFAAIALTLKELTDERDNPNDIASQATSRNSLEEQKFDGSATLIRKMEKRLVESRRMMDELLERQKLANKSKTEYSAAIVNSSSRLKLAEESIDTKDENRLVDETVDQQITDAKKFIALAKRAGEASIFIAALEAANRATDLSIRARQSAETQIKALQELYKNLESHKKQSNSEAKKIIKAVIDEEDAVITSATQGIQKALEQALAAVVTLESGLAAKEDHALAEGINNVLEKFDAIDDKTNELERSFENDKESYQSLLNDLESAIDDADSAISRASSECNDSDAGSAGDGALSSARSSNPSKASWGEARATIKSRIQSAKSAEQYADNAYNQARSAIAAAEAAREREAERQRQAERDRQEANERANEARRSISVGSNESGRKF